MKIAILGYGEQGRSAYEYWQSQENVITVCDAKEELELPEGVKRELGAGYLQGLERFDLIVRGPSVHPRDIVAANGPEILEKVTTNTNEFFRVCPSRNLIGVTGTKGKGTTSTLITKMLEADGKRVHLGGNIGIPPLDLLRKGIQADDWVVLELANFQLIDLKISPHIAVCLMVTPEHLDWHTDTDEYYKTKSQLFRHQTPEDIAIYYAANENSQRIGNSGSARKVPYAITPGAIVDGDHITIDGQQICRLDELKLLGRHNWQNACAAVTTVWQIAQNAKAMHSVLTSFTGLEHRLELVRELNDVKYYDDSFGTTPDTARVAIEAFTQPKVIILGGSDKGATYEELARTVKQGNVRQAVLIGTEAGHIQAALEAAGFTSFIPGGAAMPEIVVTAQKAAQPGDVVLLSPACASFDMFRNYKDRGEQFKAAVQALQ